MSRTFCLLANSTAMVQSFHNNQCEFLFASAQTNFFLKLETLNDFVLERKDDLAVLKIV